MRKNKPLLNINHHLKLSIVIRIIIPSIIRLYIKPLSKKIKMVDLAFEIVEIPESLDLSRLPGFSSTALPL
jgi:hypothetical protein